MMEVALYKGVKRVQGATKKEFKEAVYSNLFWENFSEKKSDVCENVGFYDCHATSFYDYYSNISAAIRALLTHSISKRHLIYKSFLAFSRSLSCLVVLFLFQNNPIRWFLAVRKYEQGK